MRNRCSSKKYIDAHRYIQRGITVCPEWNKFDAFESWAMSNGFNPGLTIDRIDNNKGYSPDNCRFVDQRTNCNNREVTLMVDYHGSKVSLKMLMHEKQKDSHYWTIYQRIKRGWDHTEAIDTPIRIGAYANRWL